MFLLRINSGDGDADITVSKGISFSYTWYSANYHALSGLMNFGYSKTGQLPCLRDPAPSGLHLQALKEAT
jgi:hypothetical protein